MCTTTTSTSVTVDRRSSPSIFYVFAFSGPSGAIAGKFMEQYSYWLLGSGEGSRRDSYSGQVR